MNGSCEIGRFGNLLQQFSLRMRIIINNKGKCKYFSFTQ